MPSNNNTEAQRDPITFLARYVAVLVWQPGGFETFLDAAEKPACELYREGMSVEEIFEYILIGVARGLASFDDEELKQMLASLETEEGKIAEAMIEQIASKAHELIKKQSPKFYMEALKLIEKRCGGKEE